MIKMFRTYNDIYSKEKKQNNKTIVPFINKYRKILGTIYSILLLDGPLLRSTKVFLKKLDCSIIICERDYKTYKLQVKNEQELCKYYHLTLNDYLSIKDSIKINIAYFDYMSTVEGNSECKPLVDISLFLQKNSCSSIVFALTFSARNRLGKFYDRKTIKEQYEKDFLVPIFMYHKFRVCDKIVKQYNTPNRQTMVFYCFFLLKDNKIDPNSIEFVVDTNGNYIGY